MITLLLLLMLLCIIALVVLALGGLLVVCWPLVLILAIGLVIDILVLKAIFQPEEALETAPLGFVGGCDATKESMFQDL